MSLLLTIFFVLLMLLAAAALFTHFVARKLEKSFPPQGEWVDVDGERIHYRRMGQGPAIELRLPAAAGVPAPFRGLAIARPGLRRFVSHTVAAPMAIANTRAVLGALFAPHAARPDFPLRGGGLYGLRRASFHGASTDMVAVGVDLPAQQERYGELRMPVSILFGEGDRVLDWRAHGEALRARVPQAQLKVVPGGHMIPATDAAGTAAWLEDCARAAHADLCKSAVLSSAKT